MILSLDWVDLAGTLKAIGGAPSATVIQVSLDQHLHNGWSMDYQGLPPVDLFIAGRSRRHGRRAARRARRQAKPTKPRIVPRRRASRSPRRTAR